MPRKCSGVEVYDRDGNTQVENNQLKIVLRYGSLVDVLISLPPLATVNFLNRAGWDVKSTKKPRPLTRLITTQA